MTSSKYGSQPTGKCIGSVGLGVGGMVERCLQGADASVHQPLGTRVAEDADPAEGSEVVDGVERSGAGVEGDREPTRGFVREPGEAAYQDEEVPDQQVAEDHVEQQLLVGPLRAAGGTSKFSDGGRVDGPTEVRTDPVHLGSDVGGVHMSLPGPLRRLAASQR